MAYKILSTVGRSWPAHGVVVPVGESRHEHLPGTVLGTLQALHEGGLLVLEELPKESPAPADAGKGGAPAKGADKAPEKAPPKGTDSKGDPKKPEADAGKGGAPAKGSGSEP